MWWERAADDLSTDDLKWCSGILDLAGDAAYRLSDVIKRIECLVSGDEEGALTGCFHAPGDVSILLFFIAGAVDNIQAMIEIGDFATSWLINSEIYQGPQEARARLVK